MEPILTDVKQISHYLRSRVISIHSTISLVILKTRDKEIKKELELARDVLIQEELSRIDLLYYSLLEKKDFEVIIQNYNHEGIFKNIQITSHKKKFLARIDFLLNIMSNLVDKMEISSEGQCIKCNIYAEDHNDYVLMINLFATCVRKILPLNSLEIKKENWGYELQFELQNKMYV